MTRTLPTPSAVPLREPVVALVRRAGAAILEVYGTADVGTTLKDDESPLTRADLAAHRLILEGLSILTPGVPVLSEEAELRPFAERARWAAYWLVDPLDGTKEFLARNGEFTVNVALIVNHDAALGVVGVPARDVIYTGVPGQSATRIDGWAAARRIATRRPGSRPLRVVASRSHRGTSLDGLLERIGPFELVPSGSALKFCLLAEGDADLYPRLGPTSEWDTAAAQAVLVAAGGSVVTADGAPLRYNTKADILNPHFLASGDPDHPWLSPFAAASAACD